MDIKIVNPIVHTNGNYLVMAEKNGQKLYLYKKDNDNSIYVSTTYHIKEKEQNKENINNKNKGLER